MSAPPATAEQIALHDEIMELRRRAVPTYAIAKRVSTEERRVTEREVCEIVANSLAESSRLNQQPKKYDRILIGQRIDAMISLLIERLSGPPMADKDLVALLGSYAKLQTLAAQIAGLEVGDAKTFRLELPVGLGGAASIGGELGEKMRDPVFIRNLIAEARDNGAAAANEYAKNYGQNGNGHNGNGSKPH